MSYTPNVWQVGDVITAEKLNALEQAVAAASSGGGGGGGYFEVNLEAPSAEKIVLDKTWSDIFEAYESGMSVVVKNEDGYTVSWYSATGMLSNENDEYYAVFVAFENNILTMYTDSANGYPEASN